MIKNLVLSTLEGINATVFMYGQTGAGKTFTMLGDKNNKEKIKNNNEGVLFMGLSDIMDEIKKVSFVFLSLAWENFKLNKIFKDSEKTYVVQCSYFEIYNECIYDLLGNISENLNIIENPQTQEFSVKGLTEITIAEKKDILNVIEKGENFRHYAITKLNHCSSRSHTIFSLKIKSLYNKENVIRESVVNFVDLAGSEKIAKIGMIEDDPMEKDYLRFIPAIFFIVFYIKLPFFLLRNLNRERVV
jgi:Kinesin motor domain